MTDPQGQLAIVLYKLQAAAAYESDPAKKAFLEATAHDICAVVKMLTPDAKGCHCPACEAGVGECLEPSF